MKELFWVGSSKKDLKLFPRGVIQEVGYALYCVQNGERPLKQKMFKGFGSGVYELAIEYKKDAYRSVYVANYTDAVYVIHCFQKKSKKAIKTPREEIVVIKERLSLLRAKLKGG